jgi:hypothetical protein
MSTDTIDESTAVAEARAWLRERVDHGERCPVCTQLAKVYRRSITSRSARSLIALYRAVGRDWGHLPTILRDKQADEAKMAYWGLIEEERVRRPDGGRAGWWRVTAAGQEWLQGHSTVPKYARIYDGRCLGLEGPETTIHEALGTRFNLAELMAGAN